MKLADPKVKLVDLTNEEKIVSYFRKSRPQMTEEETPSLHDIFKMGFALNGIQTYVFEVHASILFRDMMLSMRDIMGAWAISNRVAKIDEESTPLSSEAMILGQEARDKIYDDMQKIYKRLRDGETQEWVKKDLPVLATTMFTVAIDMRHLFNFIYTLELHAPWYFENIGKQFLDETKLEEIYKVHPKRDMYPDLSIQDADTTSGKLGTMNLIYKSDLSMNLQAQLIRKNIIIKSGMWNELNDNPEKLLSRSIREGFPVAVYLTDDDIESLLSVRTCWFAMMDRRDNNSWDYLLGDYVESMTPSQFLRNLSCRGCGDKCVIIEDMLTKVNHQDTHYPPCPLLLEDPSVVDDRIKKYESNSKIMNMWKKCAEEVIPFNPDNPYFRKYRSED